MAVRIKAIQRATVGWVWARSPRSKGFRLVWYGRFYLLGGDTKIEIDLLYRNYPKSSDYWDANWVTSEV